LSIVFSARRVIRHLPRYREVVTILARHGFGAFLPAGGGVRRFLPWSRTEPEVDGSLNRPEHLRMAAEELGTTFIKLGQILSTRVDLLPAPYIVALSQLRDNVAAAPIADIRRVFEADLGAPPEALFATFEEVPLASASIGQVHAATLPDGTPVVVKVQRPGVEAQVNTDLEILRDLVGLAARRTPYGEQYDLAGLVEEFGATLRAELDYRREASNAAIFRHNFQDDAHVYIPRVYTARSSRRVLTLERVEGVRPDDPLALADAGHDPHVVAILGARMILKETFEDGFFHADPHPGNFFVLPGPTIAVVDFGMVGRLDEAIRETLLWLFVAIAARDPDQIIDRLGELGVSGEGVERSTLRRDLNRLLDRFYGLPFQQLDAIGILQDAMQIAQRHHLQLPTDLALLIKTIVMNEAIGRRLDPEFRITDVMEPEARRLVGTLYSPGNVGRRLRRTSLDLARLGQSMPRRVDRLLGQLESGNLEVSISVKDLDVTIASIGRMVNRVLVGVLMSATILALALTLRVIDLADLGPLIRAAMIGGFILALIGGAYLMYSILRGDLR
jgi:ubiquinone biosynthesis protein